MTVPPRSSGAPPIPSGSGTRGLALASLVCGVVGLITSIVVVGGFLALVGLVLGVIHLRTSRESRLMGWTGVWLSVLSVVASAVCFVVFVFGIRSMQAGGPSVRSGFDPGTGGGMVGAMIPGFEWTTLDGETEAVRDLKGRRVVLTFWATWCTPCLEEVADLIRFHHESDTNAVAFVAVSTEDRVVLKEFVRRREIPYRVAHVSAERGDPPLGQIQGLPTTLFLDPDGRIERVHSGPITFDQLKSLSLGAQGAP